MLFKRANALMRFMYQSVSSITIPPSGNPQANVQNLPNPASWANFWSNPRGLGFPRIPYFNKFYTFSPFLRPRSLICPLNIYQFVGRTFINEKHVRIVLICISYWLTSGQMPCPPGRNLVECLWGRGDGNT